MKKQIGIFVLMVMTAGLLALPADARRGNGVETTGYGPGRSDDLLLAASGSLLVTGSQGQTPAAPETPENGLPELVVADPLFDFGRVLDGTSVEHEFLIENRGSGDLAIEQVLTG